jgi:hypothetical protein
VPLIEEGDLRVAELRLRRNAATTGGVQEVF